MQPFKIICVHCRSLFDSQSKRRTCCDSCNLEIRRKNIEKTRNGEFSRYLSEEDKDYYLRAKECNQILNSCWKSYGA